MITTVKSPVNRMGGKYYLTGWITQYIPEHVTYVEPFCGAGHLLFSKEPSPIEILNDVDDNLVNLYRCIQDGEKRSRLITFLNETPYARSIFQSWKYGDIPQDEIERAGRYFFLCKASFAGDVERGGFAVPSITGRNPAQTYQNGIDALEHIAKRLKGITIECLNYAECIKRYDSETTLFYCDPPYLNTEDYYGKGCFTQDDHCTLAELLHSVKSKVLITHYQNSLYDDLYKGWQRYEYQSFKGSYKSEGEEKPKTLECLFTNFEPVKTRGLFDAME